MTKGAIRKARKEAQAAGQSWNIETGSNGQPEIVRERTTGQERKHAIRMEKWARRHYES